MAITRCPYCRAIVDEKDQYCSSCGTQILYPEDAEAEEEIPGEKILDADVEDKDYSIPEPGEGVKDAFEEDEKDGAEDEESEEKSEEESEDVIVLEESEAPDKPATEELASVLKAGEREAESVPPPAPAAPEAPPALPVRRGRRRGPDVIQPVFNFGTAPEPKPGTKTAPIEPPAQAAVPAEPPAEEPVPPEPEASVPAPEPPAPPAPESGPEAPPGEGGEKRPTMAVTFDTRELESIGPTVDLGRHQIEQFLEVLREKEEEGAAAAPPPTGLPPWANGLKETPAPESEPESEPEPGEEPEAETEPERDLEGEALEEDEEEEGAEGKPDTAAGTPLFRTDSGVGLPERISQAKLPFAREATAEEEAGPAGLDLGEAEEAEREARPPFRLSVFLKARAFDLLFIVAVWLAAVWLAARALEKTIFELFASSSTALFLFGGALLALYVFLFAFFLGETLGDRLFRDADEDADN